MEMTKETDSHRTGTARKPHEDQNINTLLAGLHDPKKEARAEAMHGLVSLGRAAVSPCIALLRDEDWRIRYRAAEALGLLGDGSAYAALVGALDDEKDHVRYMAAKGLGLLGDPGAVEHLKSKQQDENEFVRLSVARALGRIGGAEAVLALRTAQCSEECDRVREGIEQALRDAGAKGR